MQKGVITNINEERETLEKVKRFIETETAIAIGCYKRAIAGKSPTFYPEDKAYWRGYRDGLNATKEQFI